MLAKLFAMHVCAHQVFWDSFSARHTKSVATPAVKYTLVDVTDKLEVSDFIDVTLSLIIFVKVELSLKTFKIIVKS